MLFKQLLAFRPSRLDIIFACKTFVAGMLALFISFELDLINPMWSIGTVLIIANPYSGMVSSKCVYRLVGTVAGAIIALLLTPHLLIRRGFLPLSCLYGWVLPCMCRYLTVRHVVMSSCWRVIPPQ
ncbi:FUSC family protein [Acinetobacter vivianii]